MLLSHPVTVSAPPAPPGFKLTLGTLTLLHCGSESMFSGKGNCHFCASTSDSLSSRQIIIALTIHGGLIPNDCFRDEPITQFWSFRACWIYSSLWGSSYMHTHTKMRAFSLYLVIICESHLESRGRTSLRA